MKAIVVYESHWGNTAAVSRAIAEGIGPEAQAMSTAEATGAVVADADLIVAGSPLLGFSLPTDGMLKGIAVVKMLLARAGGKAARWSLAAVAASAGIGVLLHLGMIPFCGYLEWRALLTRQPLPDWMFQERH